MQPFTTTLSLLRDGKLVALAVSAPTRSPLLPDVPTTIEAGLTADSVYPFYSGLFVPANTPRAVVDRLHQEAAKALQSPAVRERFASLGIEPMPMTPAEFATFFKNDVEATVALAKAAKVQTQ